MPGKVLDYINGEWTEAKAADFFKAINPAKGAAIAEVILTPKAIVAEAVEAAHNAFHDWRRSPVTRACAVAVSL
jgi:acyl-CoA reductase-like NAD-dependent aldehyde dehydrogenase